MKKLLILLFSLSLPKYLFKKTKIVRGSVHRNDRFGGVHRAWGHVFSNHLQGTTTVNTNIQHYLRLLKMECWPSVDAPRSTRNYELAV